MKKVIGLAGSLILAAAVAGCGDSSSDGATETFNDMVWMDDGSIFYTRSWYPEAEGIWMRNASGDQDIVLENGVATSFCSDPTYHTLFHRSKGIIGLGMYCHGESRLYEYSVGSKVLSPIQNTSNLEDFVQVSSTVGLGFLGKLNGGFVCNVPVIRSGDEIKRLDLKLYRDGKVEVFESNVMPCSFPRFTGELAVSGEHAFVSFQYLNDAGKVYSAVGSWNIGEDEIHILASGLADVNSISLSTLARKLFISTSTSREPDPSRGIEVYDQIGLVSVDLDTLKESWMVEGSDVGDTAISPDGTTLAYAIAGEFKFETVG